MVKPYGLENGVVTWSFSASTYVQESVPNAEHFPREQGYRLKPKAPRGPFPAVYAAELDSSEELAPEWATFLQSLVGVLR